MTRIIVVTQARPLAGARTVSRARQLPLSDCGRRSLDGLEKGLAEALANERAGALKRSLSTEQPYYLNPPPI